MQKRVCGNAQFLHGCFDVSYRSWDYSKNPCTCGNRTLPKQVHHRGLRKGCRPRAIQVLMMHWAGKCAISAQAWVLAVNPWSVRNIKQTCGNCAFPHTPFMRELCVYHGITFIPSFSICMRSFSYPVIVPARHIWWNGIWKNNHKAGIWGPLLPTWDLS